MRSYTTEWAEAKTRCQEILMQSIDFGYPSISDNLSEDHLRMLLRVSNAINSVRKLDPLLDVTIDLLVGMPGFNRGAIYLSQIDGTLQCVRSRSRTGVQQPDDFMRHIAETVHTNRSPFISANAARDGRLSTCTVQHDGTVFCGPLKALDGEQGVIYADNCVPNETVYEGTINAFAAFCNLAATAIANARVQAQLEHEKTILERLVSSSDTHEMGIIGGSDVISRLRSRISTMAASPLDVLIVGESGTGKELVARALHTYGRRATKRFVAVDCGSLSDNLMESELFGHRKGAFTGALDNRVGMMEIADGGVLFFDEISNLPYRLQGKLLRVLQEREIRRVGEVVQRKIDVQIVAATNRDLGDEIRRGRFRRDLYYRLNGGEIRVPALREHREDIAELAGSFLAQTAKQEGNRNKCLAPEAMRLLQRYTYPGNVRELKNAVQRAYYVSNGPTIYAKDLPDEIRNSESRASSPSEETMAAEILQGLRTKKIDFETGVKKPYLMRKFGDTVLRLVIRAFLTEYSGRYREAFRALGIAESRYSTTIQFLKRHGCYLDFREFRR